MCTKPCLWEGIARQRFSFHVRASLCGSLVEPSSKLQLVHGKSTDNKGTMIDSLVVSFGKGRFLICKTCPGNRQKFLKKEPNRRPLHKKMCTCGLLGYLLPNRPNALWHPVKEPKDVSSKNHHFRIFIWVFSGDPPNGGFVGFPFAKKGVEK